MEACDLSRRMPSAWFAPTVLKSMVSILLPIGTAFVDHKEIAPIATHKIMWEDGVNDQER